MAIKCDAAFEALLEADPVELAGRGDSDLAAHVRECERCGAVAANLLAGQTQLAQALLELRPRTDVAAALMSLRVRGRRRLVWERVSRWGPVAAAAAIAAAMVLQALPAARMVPGESVPAVSQAEPLLEVPSGQNVMVFETRDRSAKVIWFN
jgi:anti-sigma-K factor RskA